MDLNLYNFQVSNLDEVAIWKILNLTLLMVKIGWKGALLFFEVKLKVSKIKSIYSSKDS